MDEDGYRRLNDGPQLPMPRRSSPASAPCRCRRPPGPTPRRRGQTPLQLFSIGAICRHYDLLSPDARERRNVRNYSCFESNLAILRSRCQSSTS